MSRQDASDLLMSEKEGGVFLVRDSISIHGDFVLCVREDSKVSHYIINKIQQGDQIRYRIGDQIFPDIPNLLAFYKLHYLDTTPLIRPAPRKIQRVMARYDFEGNDPDDLPFRKGNWNLPFDRCFVDVLRIGEEWVELVSRELRVERGV